MKSEPDDMVEELLEVVRFLKSENDRLDNLVKEQQAEILRLSQIAKY